MGEFFLLYQGQFVRNMKVQVQAGRETLKVRSILETKYISPFNLGGRFVPYIRLTRVPSHSKNECFQ